MTHHSDFDQWVEPAPLTKYVPAAQARVAFWRGVVVGFLVGVVLGWFML
jgi:hypothetical protein